MVFSYARSTVTAIDDSPHPHALESIASNTLRAVVLSPDSFALERARALVADQFRVSLLGDVAELSRAQGDTSPDLFIVDWPAKGKRTVEFEKVEQIHALYPQVPIVMLPSSSADMEADHSFRRIRAFDQVPKRFAVRLPRHSVPPDPMSPDAQEISLDNETSFVRCSPRMKEIEAQCGLVARTDIPVLVLGESGTGKEVIAKLVYKMSARSQQPFLKVNCAAMPSDLLESELFGYEQGAFTGAVKSKPGKFEICNDGTIFLDEIGEMSCALQAKLLQVLQDGSFSRLGSRSALKVNVRVIAATNIDMKQAMINKTFREDLYYRLNGFTIKMPPLRERTEEIPLLSGHFMRAVASRYDCNPLPISPAMMHALMSHPWPGNLRELENVIKRYLILGDDQAVINELTPDLRQPIAGESEMPGFASSLKHIVRNVKGSAESVAIAQTLECTGWNRKAAAGALKISYKALLYKIKQYDLTPPLKVSSRTMSEYR